jgi:hypothetical protein
MMRFFFFPRSLLFPGQTYPKHYLPTEQESVAFQTIQGLILTSKFRYQIT